MSQASLPLSALRAFEAAARLGSFRAAAAELSVTPSAISHQIRVLEDRLGASLFVRTVRAVELTAAGKLLARDTRRAFEALSAGMARVESAARDRRLKVSALPLFTNVWLAPRLALFQARHPDIEVDVETTNRVVDLRRGEADVAIRNIYAPTPGLAARKLLDLRATPVCAAPVASTLRRPADLAHTTLIHISARTAGWPEWLAAAGVKGLKSKASLSFDTIPAAVEAAAKGRGVLLGLMPMLWDMAGAEKLVTPFADTTVDAGAYFLVHRRTDRARAAVRDFSAWLVAEMRADARRLRTLRPM
jgi:LysR family glycine cleavage system transcriptional activator